MIVPSLTDLEKNLFDISQEANVVIDKLYDAAKANGDVTEEGYMKDARCIGSSIMHLDRRKPLYKFLRTVPYDSQKFYFIMDHGGQVSINLRNLNTGHSYTLSRAAYDVVVKRLKEIYEWEIYNNVNID